MQSYLHRGCLHKRRPQHPSPELLALSQTTKAKLLWCCWSAPCRVFSGFALGWLSCLSRIPSSPLSPWSSSVSPGRPDPPVGQGFTHPTRVHSLRLKTRARSCVSGATQGETDISTVAGPVLPLCRCCLGSLARCEMEVLLSAPPRLHPLPSFPRGLLECQCFFQRACFCSRPHRTG